jgi:hypothetical protein
VVDGVVVGVEVVVVVDGETTSAFREAVFEHAATSSNATIASVRTRVPIRSIVAPVRFSRWPGGRRRVCGASRQR